ncbi:MAG: PH domain-containing protein [Phycisphaerae bacterium]|nr:PH domain-containing protein [Phycisphaerae bacterium]
MTPAEALADVEVSTSAREILEDGEIILLVARPSVRLIPAFAAAPLLLLLTAAAAVWAGRVGNLLSAEKTDGMLLALGCVAVLVVAVQVGRWRNRRYILTNRRVLKRTGRLYTSLRQCTLGNLTNVEVILFPPEHLTGLGSVCFQTREGFQPELRWGNLARPEAVAAEVRKAMRHNHG